MDGGEKELQGVAGRKEDQCRSRQKERRKTDRVVRTAKGEKDREGNSVKYAGKGKTKKWVKAIGHREHKSGGSLTLGGDSGILGACCNRFEKRPSHLCRKNGNQFTAQKRKGEKRAKVSVEGKKNTA